MEFDEALALKLKERYSVSDNAYKIWKSRGIIPKQYLNKDFRPTEGTPISDSKELQTAKNIVRVLNNPKLNRKGLARFAGISDIRAAGIRAGKTKMNSNDLVCFRKSINTLRIECKTIISELECNRDAPEKKIRLFFDRKEITTTLFLNSNIMLRRKIDGWLLNRRVFPSEEKDLLLSCFVEFVVELNI